MHKSAITSALMGAAALFLGGCIVSTHIVKLYDGPEKDPSEIALLYVDPNIMVTRVNKIIGHPDDMSRAVVHSVWARREIAAMAPGSHDLVAYFFYLHCVQSDSGFPIKFLAEPGKKYRLKPELNVKRARWKLAIAEYDGEDIEDTTPAMKSLCERGIRYIRLDG